MIKKDVGTDLKEVYVFVLSIKIIYWCKNILQPVYTNLLNHYSSDWDIENIFLNNL